MFRIPTVVLLCAVTATPLRADTWQSRWREAVERSDLGALAAMAKPARDVDVADRRGRTALMAAAAGGDLALLQRLIDLGADVDRRNSGGGTALMFSAQYDRAAAARRLVEHGATLDLQAAKGFTALMIAVLKGSHGVIGVLLEHGADPNIRDVQGFTPLMRAVAENRGGAVERLLNVDRTEVNATDERGIGALHLAAAAGRVAIARRLLARGADPHLRDANGNTPRSLAEAGGHRQLVELLDREAGIKRGRARHRI